MLEAQKVFYPLKSKDVLPKQICKLINQDVISKRMHRCYQYDDHGIYLQTFINPQEVKQKLEKNLKIKLDNFKIINSN